MTICLRNQALACGKPVYLLCPPGHLEQSCNERYYFRHFIGVSGPSTEPIDTWTDKAMGLGDQPVTLSQMQAISANTSANIRQQASPDLQPAHSPHTRRLSTAGAGDASSRLAQPVRRAGRAHPRPPVTSARLGAKCRRWVGHRVGVAGRGVLGGGV